MVELRNAIGEDIPAVHAIYHHYVATSIASLQDDLPTIESMRHNFARLRGIGMPFLVAVDDATSRVCGYAYGDVFNERSGYQRTAEDSVYIHPEFCGRGIARRLLHGVFLGLMDCGKKVVIAKMSIVPGADAGTLPSAKLHVSMGFEEVGRLRKVGFKLGMLVDVLILQLDLDSYGS